MDGKIESRWIGALALIGVPHILTIRAGGKGGGDGATVGSVTSLNRSIPVTKSGPR